MNTRTDEKRAQVMLCDRSASCELSNDYTLPDYEPEIRRVLKVSATVLPASKYASASRAELGGTVEYRVLYIAPDAKLYSLPLAAEYELSVPLETTENTELSDGITIVADVSAAGASARVSSPRKLTVKCKVNANVRAYAFEELSERTSGDTPEHAPERLDGECVAEYICAAVSDTKELSAEFDAPSDSVRIIESQAELFINDSSFTGGYAECHGELAIRLLVCDEAKGTEPERLEKRIAFEDNVEIDADSPEASVARGYVSELKVSVDGTRISCTASVFCEITAHKKRKVCYTKDIYSTELFCETAHKTKTLYAPLYTASSNYSLSERTELGEGHTARGAEAVLCYADASLDGCTYTDGRYNVAGNCKYTVIAKKDGEYFGFDHTVPFKYELASGEEFSSAGVSVRPAFCTARINGSQLSIDSEMYVSAELSKEFCLPMLSEVRFGEPLEKRSSDMIICYPTPDDTLWSVSKRYAVPKLSLGGITDPEASLDGIDYLIVSF